MNLKNYYNEKLLFTINKVIYFIFHFSLNLELDNKNGFKSIN